MVENFVFLEIMGMERLFAFVISLIAMIWTQSVKLQKES